MKKKGVSGIIGVVILLSLVLAMSVIVWVVVHNIVSDASGDINLGVVSLDLKILGVSSNNGNLIVNVRREKGKGELEGLKFIVASDDDEEMVEVKSSLDEFDSDKYTLTLKKVVALNVSTVSVAPVLSSGTADIKDVWKKPRAGIECVATCPDSNTVCAGVTLDNGCGGNCPGTLGPACADPSTVDCGEAIHSINDCVGCELNGTRCEEGSACELVDGTSTCVEQLRIFVTSTKYNGDLGGVSGADAKCMGDANRPSGAGIWKALVGSSDRQVGGSDWVLFPNRHYYNVSGVLLDTTDSNAWFTFPWDIALTGVHYIVATGFTSQGILRTSNTCLDWSSSTSSSYPAVGLSNYKTSYAVFYADYGSCSSTSLNLYCVEQPSS